MGVDSFRGLWSHFCDYGNWVNYFQAFKSWLLGCSETFFRFKPKASKASLSQKHVFLSFISVDLFFSLICLNPINYRLCLIRTRTRRGSQRGKANNNDAIRRWKAGLVGGKSKSFFSAFREFPARLLLLLSTSKREFCVRKQQKSSSTFYFFLNFFWRNVNYADLKF